MAAEPSRQASSLLEEERERYARHLVLPDFGEAGQKKLKSSRVLVVGAGGLGSSVLMSLAAAGVGTIGIVENERIELSNLHRQLLYASDTVGGSKIKTAEKRLRAVNPGVEVVPHETRLSSHNAMDILADYDVVVDGSDNLPTRYLVNDACALLGKPDVSGAVFQYEGQVSVFDADKGPCYRCLFPEPPSPELVPSCAEAGVLGMVPGIIGNIQAIETVKLIVGLGNPLIGRLLLVEVSTMDFREVSLEKMKDCPLCGEEPSIHSLIDYDRFCGARSTGTDGIGEGSVQISVHELKRRLDSGEKLALLDVREEFEFNLVHLDAKLIPLGRLASEISTLDANEEIIVYCHTGVRSQSAVGYLRAHGFTKAMNLTGGIDAWAREVDHTLPRY